MTFRTARRSASTLSLLLAATLAAAPARAEAPSLSLPFVLSDGAVLQRDMPLPIWGHAAPAAAVTVTFAGQSKTATAGPDGAWSLKLDALSTSDVPSEMTLTSGDEKRVIKDLLVGEVWVTSGQSNMEKPVGTQRGQRPTVNAAAEIAAADHPTLRLMQIPKTGDPAEVAKSTWKHCTPENLDGTHFSAVSYFFGRKLLLDLKVPVGMIHTSWGGTRIEPWIPPATPADNPTTRNVNTRPSGLWNAMVKPLVPYAMRGALWYQGESNVMTHDRLAYLGKMKALVAGWREQWGEGDFPFLYVQLAPFTYTQRANENNTPDELPALWEAQLNALHEIPNTGMVVTTDITDRVTDIHPTQKLEVGERLALWALAKTYGRDVVCSGPLYKSADFAAGKAILHFDSIGAGLTSRDGRPLAYFTIAGPDGKFVPATATIEGDTVVVSSPDVPNPQAVRFAWDETATPNLANKNGLPASPFRTDTLPLPPPIPASHATPAASRSSR
jgi:sialate O-acetylesterase